MEEVATTTMTATPVEIKFDSLNYSVIVKKKPRTLLRNVSATIEAGKLTAIMGPSGAGKTTLLNALSGRLAGGRGKKTGGTLLVNGEPVSFDQIKKLGSYVMQDDVLLNELTPRELITFSANMTLTSNAKERKDRVKDVIKKLRLNKCADTPVGQPGIRRGISGGERKRTSIGVELVTNPGVLYLDEPTSGLDSETAAQVMEIMKSLTRQGHTIACTIHQPSSEIFHLFDNLILLSNGELEYFGSVSGAKRHFAKKGYIVPPEVNPADFYMKVLTLLSNPGEEKTLPSSMSIGEKKLEGEMTLDDVEMGVFPSGSQIVHHEDYEPNEEDEDSGGSVEPSYALGKSDWRTIVKNRKKKPSLLAQQYYLIHRSWLTYTRNKLATVGKLIQYVGVVLFASFLNYDLSDGPGGVPNKAGYLFSKVALFSFMPANGVVLQFPVERPVFMREYAKGLYHPLLYFISKNVVETPFQLAFVILTSWDYFVVGFETDAEEFFKVLMAYCMVSLIGSSVGLVVGAAIRDVGQGMELAPAVIIPQMLVGGLFIALDDISDVFRWLSDISFFRWAFQAAMTAVFSNPDEVSCTHKQSLNSQDLCTSEAVLEFYGLRNSWGISILILASIFIILRALAYLVLHVLAWLTSSDG